jgi:SHAQKYF class myb-like DNA-binding protein
MAAEVQAQAQAKNRERGLPEGEDPLGGREPVTVCAPGAEHTGRWTRQEHERFLTALKRYGKEWKKVAAMVRTRTVVQTRTHAQKYFQKLQKQMATGVNLETALEMTMDDSDYESGEEGGSRYGSRGASKRRTQKPPPPPRPPARRPPPHEMPPPSVPEEDPADQDDDSMDEEYAFDDMDMDDDDDEEMSEENAAEAIQMVRGQNPHPQLYPHPHEYDYSSGASTVNSFNKAGGSSLSISIPDPSQGGMAYPPHPSPAAHGKRKAAEVLAAETLCATASQDHLDPVDALQSLRGCGANGNGEEALDGGMPPRKQTRLRDLSILNPEGLDKFDNPHQGASGAQTPWESEVRALSAFSLVQDCKAEEPKPPSELQRNLIALVLKGDVDGMRALIAAAKVVQSGQPIAASDLEIHGVDDNGKTVLMVIAGLGTCCLKSIRLFQGLIFLLRADPDVVAPAVAVDMCQLLVDHAAAIGAVDKTCCTALHW